MRTWPIFALIAFLVLAGCANQRAANPEAAINASSDAVFQEALAQAQKSHAKTKAERDAAEGRAEVATAARKAAEDKLVHENRQRALEQQAADQQSDHRWERAAIVASCVLAVASLRFPALSGLLLSLAACTSAAAYGFAAAGWIRGHVWLVPCSGVALAALALIHHLTGKDHVLRTGVPLVAGARATVARWMPRVASIKAHWHLPPWLTGMIGLFHRHPAASPPPAPTAGPVAS